MTKTIYITIYITRLDILDHNLIYVSDQNQQTLVRDHTKSQMMPPWMERFRFSDTKKNLWPNYSILGNSQWFYFFERRVCPIRSMAYIWTFGNLWAGENFGQLASDSSIFPPDFAWKILPNGFSTAMLINCGGLSSGHFSKEALGTGNRETAL